MLKQVQHALRTAMDDALRQLGTTASQYAVLSVLSETRAISGAELARRCFVTPQTMNELITALENAGLVARAPHAVHGRILEVSLTEAGELLLGRANAAVAQIEQTMLSGLSDAERAALLDLLRRCAAALTPGRQTHAAAERKQRLAR